LYVAKPAGSAGLKAAQYTAKGTLACTARDRWSRFRHSGGRRGVGDFGKACHSSRWP